LELITGPLGLWKFPILNLLLAIVLQSRQPVQTQKKQEVKKVKNVEIWQWKDIEGNTRYIKVHRYVEPVEE